MKRFIRSRAFIVLLLALVIFTGYKFFVNYQHINRLKVRINNLEQNIAVAESKQNELQEELENINTPEYIEKIARNELGLVKPGEVLLIPVEEDVKED